MRLITLRGCLDQRNPLPKSGTHFDVSIFRIAVWFDELKKISSLYRLPCLPRWPNIKSHPEVFTRLYEKSRKKRRVNPTVCLFTRKWHVLIKKKKNLIILNRSKQPLRWSIQYLWISRTKQIEGGGEYKCDSGDRQQTNHSRIQTWLLKRVE